MLMHSISVKNRALFSIIFNIIRAAFNFITMLLVARWLMPDDFGKYMFIFMGFIGLLGIIDSGLSLAFFTFISKDLNFLAPIRFCKSKLRQKQSIQYLYLSIKIIV